MTISIAYNCHVCRVGRAPDGGPREVTLDRPRSWCVASVPSRLVIDASAGDAIISGVEAKSPEHAALGRALHELRLEAGVSQDELARRAGMHRTYIGGIERGERNVSFANLLKIADALDERPSKLLSRYERLL
jgi:DNA-binding XRE family transcriptional regulator